MVGSGIKVFYLGAGIMPALQVDGAGPGEVAIGLGDFEEVGGFVGGVCWEIRSQE